jgi:hypothetical protein
MKKEGIWEKTKRDILRKSSKIESNYSVGNIISENDIDLKVSIGEDTPRHRTIIMVGAAIVTLVVLAVFLIKKSLG